MATPAERAVAIWETLGGQVGRKNTYTLNGVAITATLDAVDEAAGSVTLTCSATTGSGANKVSLPLDGANPFVFVNPPIGVVTQEEVWDRSDPLDPILLQPRIVSVGGAYTLTAAKMMVYQAVTEAARRRGWNG